jgi:hypothetical protein
MVESSHFQGLTTKDSDDHEKGLIEGADGPPLVAPEDCLVLAGRSATIQQQS